MRLRIITDEDQVVGECETDDESPWRDLLTYAAGQWEAEAKQETGTALVVYLASQ